MTPTVLQFLGAAGTVTGSRFLVRTPSSNVLVDAGLFQGPRRLRELNWSPCPIDPTTIDAVILSHAHIDHSGWLPRLVKDGFAGKIVATPETRQLCEILLPDAAHLQEEEARFANERGYSKHRPARPLYTRDDAAQALALFDSIPFDTSRNCADGVAATLTPAGHILGSASVHLEIDDGDVATTLLVSGDLGRGDHPFVPGPFRPPAADTVLIESTYGASTHADRLAEDDAVAALITRTAERGGVVLIPAFAVDRTELMLLLLRRLMDDDRIPRLPVYADSPMALSVLDVYRQAARGTDERVAHQHEHSLGDFDPGGGLHECKTVEESIELNGLTAPSIIISASGMASGGRVLHHLSRLLPDHRNAVILCGFQAQGTRGRSLLAGERTIKMLGRHVAVRAEVLGMTSMSVHADQDDLFQWVERLPECPQTIYVVHGEPTESDALAARLTDDAGLTAVIPKMNERVVLDHPAIKKPPWTGQPPRVER